MSEKFPAKNSKADQPGFPLSRRMFLAGAGATLARFEAAASAQESQSDPGKSEGAFEAEKAKSELAFKSMLSEMRAAAMHSPDELARIFIYSHEDASHEVLNPKIGESRTVDDYGVYRASTFIDYKMEKDALTNVLLGKRVFVLHSHPTGSKTKDEIVDGAVVGGARVYLERFSDASPPSDTDILSLLESIGTEKYDEYVDELRNIVVAEQGLWTYGFQSIEHANRLQDAFNAGKPMLQALWGPNGGMAYKTPEGGVAVYSAEDFYTDLSSRAFSNEAVELLKEFKETSVIDPKELESMRERLEATHKRLTAEYPDGEFGPRIDKAKFDVGVLQLRNMYQSILLLAWHLEETELAGANDQSIQYASYLIEAKNKAIAALERIDENAVSTLFSLPRETTVPDYVKGWSKLGVQMSFIPERNLPDSLLDI